MLNGREELVNRFIKIKSSDSSIPEIKVLKTLINIDGKVIIDSSLLSAEETLEEGASWSRSFIDKLLWRSHELKEQDQKIIIGIDTTWVPDGQRGYIPEMINKLKEEIRKRSIKNIEIIREDGKNLANVILAAKNRNTKFSDIIVLGDETVLNDNTFNVLRPGVNPSEWAFFVGIRKPAVFTDNSNVRLFEMLAKARDLESGKTVKNTIHIRIVQKGQRTYTFVIPKAEILKYEFMIELYNLQIEVMKHT